MKVSGMINALAAFGLCMLLTIVFSVIYIIFIFKSYDTEEVENYAGGIILAVLMFFILSMITANIEISRQNLIEQIESMEGGQSDEIREAEVEE